MHSAFLSEENVDSKSNCSMPVNKKLANHKEWPNILQKEIKVTLVNSTSQNTFSSFLTDPDLHLIKIDSFNKNK